MKRVMIILLVLLAVAMCGCSSPDDDKELRIAARYVLGDFTISNDGNFDWHDAEIVINGKYTYTLNRLEAGDSRTIGAYRFTDSYFQSYDSFEDPPRYLVLKLDGWKDLRLTFS